MMYNADEYLTDRQSMRRFKNDRIVEDHKD